MSSEAEVKFGFGKSVLYSLILTVLFLTIAEFGLRGWAYFFREQYERYDSESETFVLVPGQHRRGSRTVNVNSDGFIGEEFQPAGPDLFRIVSIGDSCTFGTGDYETAYPALLNKELQSRIPGPARLEVVNAGVEGHTSRMALSRLQHNVTPLRPDIVIVYIGWNDLMKFDPSGQAADGIGSSAIRLLDSLWLTKGTRKFLFYYVRPKINPPMTGPESYQNSFKDYAPKIYEQNLKVILETIEELDARALLVTLPTVVRPEMSVDELNDAGVFFPYYPSAYAVGDLLDLIRAYNDTIRKLATDGNVELVDLAGAFEELGASQVYFHDTMHLNYKGRRIIARLIADHILARGILPTKEDGG